MSHSSLVSASSQGLSFLCWSWSYWRPAWMTSWSTCMPHLPISLKCSVLEDVASGLLYLHKRNPPVIHRDLTAKNILLTSHLAAKIADMGNSHIIDMKPGRLAKTLSKLPGTLVYMPPEALDDRHSYGPPLDVFSFGHLALFTVLQVHSV